MRTHVLTNNLATCATATLTDYYPVFYGDLRKQTCAKTVEKWDSCTSSQLYN